MRCGLAVDEASSATGVVRRDPNIVEQISRTDRATGPCGRGCICARGGSPDDSCRRPRRTDGASLPLDDVFRRTGVVRGLHNVERHSGCTMTRTPGAARECSAIWRTVSACGLSMAFPENDARVPDGVRLEAAPNLIGSHTTTGPAGRPSCGPCAPRCWSGRQNPSRAPTPISTWRPHWTDVHTTPPCSPQNL